MGWWARAERPMCERPSRIREHPQEESAGALDHDDVASVLIVLRHQQTAPVGGDSQTGDGSIGWFRKQRNRLDDSARQVQHFQPGDRWAVWRLRNRFGRKATRQQRQYPPCRRFSTDAAGQPTAFPRLSIELFEL